MKRFAVLITAFAAAQTALAQVQYYESPRTTALELKLGGYKPDIDAEFAASGQRPWDNTFGAGAMLLFEIEGDRLLWQKYGSVGVGFSLGYGEKYGRAQVGDPSGTGGNSTFVAENTGFHVVPFKLGPTYRFDYAALHWNVPLVPYLKGGLAYTAWWSTKGGNIDYADGLRAAGGKWGYYGVVGLALMLDFFEPRLARDFDTDVGVNHSYLFAEYCAQKVDGFGAGGLDLSSRHWMFGLTLEY